MTMVQDNLKLLDDGGEIDTQILRKEVGSLFPHCESHVRKSAMWLIGSCALTLACRPSVSKKTKQNINHPW